ncbi:uncharacterized protein [Watersipora subatra]|uniref:uncharacterized protein n=1 Tax=Watersipora subatra TaxID=2589382 RepID=UPI00355B9C41
MDRSEDSDSSQSGAVAHPSATNDSMQQGPTLSLTYPPISDAPCQIPSDNQPASAFGYPTRSMESVDDRSIAINSARENVTCPELQEQEMGLLKFQSLSVESPDAAAPPANTNTSQEESTHSIDGELMTSFNQSSSASEQVPVEEEIQSLAKKPQAATASPMQTPRGAAAIVKALQSSGITRDEGRQVRNEQHVNPEAQSALGVAHGGKENEELPSSPSAVQRRSQVPKPSVRRSVKRSASAAADLMSIHRGANDDVEALQPSSVLRDSAPRPKKPERRPAAAPRLGSSRLSDSSILQMQQSPGAAAGATRAQESAGAVSSAYGTQTSTSSGLSSYSTLSRPNRFSEDEVKSLTSMTDADLAIYADQHAKWASDQVEKGQFSMAQKNYDYFFQYSAKLNPDCPEATRSMTEHFLGLGRALHYGNEHEQALAVLDIAFNEPQVSPVERDSILEYKARSCESLGRRKDARAWMSMRKSPR